MFSESDLVMISALEHWSYCPRQCALIHLEQTFDENIYSMKGHMLHERVDEEASELRGDVRIERAVPLWSRRLGLVGRADAVEFHGQQPFPVEYKAGPRRQWGHDDLQLRAQALCLEEMTGQSVLRGAIYYHGPRRRREVVFDDVLRQRVVEVVADVRQMLAASILPPEDGRTVVFLDRNGRFKARVEGPVSGNVLLRRAQHLAASDAAKSTAMARNIVAGKIQNARQIVLRGGREGDVIDDTAPLQECAEAMANVLIRLRLARDLDEVRGLEGEAARTYFSVFDRMVREDREAFCLNGRSRRPPLDRMNALLSFLYTLLLSDSVSAVEGVGLDPQVGFLHALRPGRPALALDLMEEQRAILADRLALTLVNRRQLARDDFQERPGGAIHLTEKGRKEEVVAYQKRKQDEVQHLVLDRKVPLGLVPHVQARLLARHLRGDLENYPPFLYR